MQDSLVIKDREDPSEGLQCLYEAFNSTVSSCLNRPQLHYQAPGQTAQASEIQYAKILAQLFLQTRAHLHLFALAEGRLQGHQRECVQAFHRLTATGLGLGHLALNDYAACGENPPCLLRDPRPAASTLGLLGYAYHQVCAASPAGYLGYLFFDEFIAKNHGRGLISLWRRIGVGKDAFTFFAARAHVDLHTFLHDRDKLATSGEEHTCAMRDCCDALLRTQEERAAASYAVYITSQLHAQMLEDALCEGDRQYEFERNKSDRMRGPPA